MGVLLFLERIPLDFLSLISEEVTNPDNPVIFSKIQYKSNVPDKDNNYS